MIINNLSFQQLKAKHAKELLELLLAESQGFNILTNTKDVTFSPALPEHISSQFSEVILFTIVNYTLHSAKIEDNIFSFEAGFGEENFGSVVSVEIDRIIQITEEDTPLFINISATLEKPKKVDNPFALNPRNKKFLKD